MRLLLLAAAIHNVINQEPALPANHSELWEYTAFQLVLDNGILYTYPGQGSLGSPSILPSGKFGTPCPGMTVSNEWFVSTLRTGLFYDFTIETFFKLNSTSGSSDQYIFDFRNRGFAVRIRNGVLVLATGDTAILIQTAVAPALNEWHHIAVTRNNGLIKLFLNGVMIGQATYTAAIWGSPTGSDLGIGSYSGGAAGSTLLGYIDQFRILLKSIYNSNFTPPTEPFTVGSFEAIVDPFRDSVKLHTSSSLSGNAIDAAGGVLSSFGAATVSDTVRKFNKKSLHLPSVGSYYSVPNTGGKFDFGSGNFTVELWFNTAVSNSGTAILAGMDSSTGKGGWALRLVNNRPSFVVSINGTSYALTIAPTFTHKLGMWSHVAISRVGNSIYAHVNGNRISITAFSGTLIDSALPLTIGADADGAQQFLGRISGLRVTKGVGRFVSLNANPRQLSDYPKIAGTSVYGRDVYANSVSLRVPFTDNIIDEKSFNTGWTLGTSALDNVNVLFGRQTVSIPTGSGTGITLSSPPPLLPSNDFTVESWIKTDYVGAIDLPIVSQPATSGTTWWLFGIKNGKLLFKFASSGDILSPSNVADGQWHHVAVTRKGSTVKMFIDGVMVSTITNSTLVNGIAAVKIGFNNITGTVLSGNQLNLSRIRVTADVSRYDSDFTADEDTIPLKNCSS